MTTVGHIGSSYPYVTGGAPISYSREWGPPYGPSQTAFADPRRQNLYENISLVFSIDDVPHFVSTTIVPSSSVEAGLATLAALIDTSYTAEVHAWSAENKIGVQPADGVTVTIDALSISPEAPVAQSVMVTNDTLDALSPTGNLSITYTYRNTERTFAVVSLGDVGADIEALAAELNANDPYTIAAASARGFSLSAPHGNPLTIDAFAYV